MTEPGKRALVLGAGMAGLLAARVLSEFYESVIVVERDRLPGHPALRKGVPQGRHLHQFLSRGPQVLAELFPRLLDELAAAGAVVVKDNPLRRIYGRIGDYELRPSGKLADPGALTLCQGSRPFMEFHVRRRVAALPNVAICDGHELVEPTTRGAVVTGARIIDRDTRDVTVIDADLVVDAMGRGTRTPIFLEQHGFGAVREKVTATAWAYSSQLIRVPEGRITERLVFISQGRDAPGGLLVAYEDNVWVLAIARAAEHGSPPTDFTGMMAAAEKFFPAAILSGLRDGQPIAPTSVYRNTAGRWHRYDQMVRFPRNLVMVGDALANFNPLYGQGMTMAALQALVLRDCLRGGADRVGKRFFHAAAKMIGPVWAMNEVSDEAAYPGQPANPRQQLDNWTAQMILRAAAVDVGVFERLLRVRNLVDPPHRLRDPLLAARIALDNLLQPTRAVMESPVCRLAQRYAQLGCVPSRRETAPPVHAAYHPL